MRTLKLMLIYRPGATLALVAVGAILLSLIISATLLA